MLLIFNLLGASGVLSPILSGVSFMELNVLLHSSQYLFPAIFELPFGLHPSAAAGDVIYACFPNIE